METKFWMVWRRYAWAPKFMHASLETAVAEAERLSKEFPNGAFFVLEAVRQIGPGTEKPIPKSMRKPGQPLTEEQKAERKLRKSKIPKSLTIADILKKRTVQTEAG